MHNCSSLGFHCRVRCKCSRSYSESHPPSALVLADTFRIRANGATRPSHWMLKSVPFVTPHTTTTLKDSRTLLADDGGEYKADQDGSMWRLSGAAKKVQSALSRISDGQSGTLLTPMQTGRGVRPRPGGGPVYRPMHSEYPTTSSVRVRSFKKFGTSLHRHEKEMCV